MKWDSLRTRLRSPDAHERLLAARVFEQSARSQDLQFLQEAAAREEVSWVKAALERAKKTAAGVIEDGETRDDEPAPSIDEASLEIYTTAVEETTCRLVHEIEPILGTLRYFARAEVDDFEKSKTKCHLDRLGELLEAIGNLSRAASSPRNEQIDLASLIQEIIESETSNTSVRVDKIGKTPLLLAADRALLSIVISNGLRNSIEASQGVPDGDRVVTVSWGDTDRDLWVTILDRGPGLPAGLDRVWDIGSTTKAGHLGMGLALAKQAARSFKGEVTLTPAKGQGARFEIRWPLAKRDPS